MTINVHPSVPARTLKDLITDVKAHPDRYSYGHAGVGTINHLGGELFKVRAGGLKILHVPYKGAGPAVRDLIGGQIPITCTSLSSALPHHRSGRLRTLAVMAQKRSVSAPDIPTAAEGGVRDAVAYTFNIVLAPAGTPRSVIDRLSHAMRKVMGERAFLDKLIKVGADPVADSNPAKAAAMLRAEFERWRPVIESLGLKGTAGAGGA
jgi:tripartite-type tricarboxylate transporter receptor subunit TctC